MRKLHVVEFVTLDGVMQGLGSPDEDRSGGFEYGGWAGEYFTDEQVAAGIEGQRETAAYLFGRKTYEKFAAFWPYQPDSDPMAAHLNATPKHVATRTLTSLDWRNSAVLTGELAPAVRALKSQGDDGTVVVLGSGALVQELIAEDLVDGYRLFLHPLLLGTGKRLFREMAQPQRLRLTGCIQTSTGVLALDYDVVPAR